MFIIDFSIIVAHTKTTGLVLFIGPSVWFCVKINHTKWFILLKKSY